MEKYSEIAKKWTHLGNKIKEKQKGGKETDVTLRQHEGDLTEKERTGMFQKKYWKTFGVACVMALSLAMISGCGDDKKEDSTTQESQMESEEKDSENSTVTPEQVPETEEKDAPDATEEEGSFENPEDTGNAAGSTDGTGSDSTDAASSLSEGGEENTETAQ